MIRGADQKDRSSGDMNKETTFAGILGGISHLFAQIKTGGQLQCERASLQELFPVSP